MCGIAGIYFINGFIGQNIEKLANRISGSMVHRGPDSQHYYSDNNILLIHNRLSIIDLSTGDQPIFNEDESKVIVLNGEIYNYKQLREELIRAGHTFKSMTDTEVVLHGFEEWGYEVVQKLTGMFAFAILDKNSGGIYLARDRMGEKPLYYYVDDDKIVFASELKGVITALDKQPKIDNEAMQLYFAYKFIPEPYSIYKGIKKLEKASYIYFQQGKIVQKQLYWDIKKLYENRVMEYNFTVAKKTIKAKIMDAVEMQMIASDVPVGAFLSGGIDSSIVTAVMSKISSRPVNTFCIGFTNKNYDESHKAQQISDIFNTKHYTHYLKYEDIMQDFDKIILNYDEPFADSSCIPTYYVSKLASQAMKVVLTGDGADELFAGYKTYDYDDLYNKVEDFPKYLTSLIKAGTLKSAKVFDRFNTKSNIGNQIFKFGELLNNIDPKLELRKTFNTQQLALLLNDNESVIEFDSELRYTYSKIKTVNNLEYSMLIDQNVILCGDMLVKVDRASMLNSLETRTPFMDRHVVEYSINIPSEFKKKGNIKKYIIKEAFSDLLPKEIINQQKQGFRVPIGDWLRTSLRSEFDKLTEKNKIIEQNIFNYDYIQAMKQSLDSGKDEEMGRLWSIFVFQKWYYQAYDRIG